MTKFAGWILVALFVLGAAVAGSGCGGGTGTCTITCRGTRPQDHWTNTFGPYRNYTSDECEKERKGSEITDVVCTKKFESN